MIASIALGASIALRALIALIDCFNDSQLEKAEAENLVNTDDPQGDTDWHWPMSILMTLKKWISMGWMIHKMMTTFKVIHKMRTLVELQKFKMKTGTKRRAPPPPNEVDIMIRNVTDIMTRVVKCHRCICVKKWGVWAERYRRKCSFASFSSLLGKCLQLLWSSLFKLTLSDRIWSCNICRRTKNGAMDKRRSLQWLLSSDKVRSGNASLRCYKFIQK